MSQFPSRTAAILLASENRSRFVGALRRFGLAVAIFVMMFCLFDFNALDTARPSWFNIYAKDAESVVMGRLAASRHEGMASHGGMLGHYSEANEPVAPEIRHQLEAYAKGAPPSQWIGYTAQIGLQGMIWGFIDKLFPTSAPTNFAVLAAIASAFAAIVTTTIIMWIGLEIGTAALIAVVLGMFNSPWFIITGKNIYLVFGTFLMPLAISCWGFHRLRANDEKQFRRFMLLMYGCFVLRFSCGFEYLTDICAASWVPAVFYAVRDRWLLRRFVRTTLFLAGACFAAFVTVFLLQTILMSFVQGTGLLGGFKSILSHAEVRLGMPLLGKDFIDPSLVENKDSLKVGMWSVLMIYMRGYIDGPQISTQAIDWPFTFGDVILLTMAVSAFVLVRFTRAKKPSPRQRKQTALVAATGVAFLASISWHILSKQHSFIHYHMNFMLWYVPFMFLFYALLGDFIGSFIMLERKPAAMSVAEKPLPESLTSIVNPKAVKKKRTTTTAKKRTKKPPAPDRT